MKHPAVAIYLMLWLAACGGGGGDGSGSGSGIDPRMARLDIYEAQKLRVLGDPGAGVPGMALTEDGNMPTAGSMSFTGSGTMRVEAGTAPFILFGDARLNVDFDTNNASGAIENSFGTNAAGDVVDYSGTITLQSSSITQGMPLAYNGTLGAGDLDLAFAGTMTGLFLGRPTSAFSAADLEADVEQNGIARTATILVTLERAADLPPS